MLTPEAPSFVRGIGALPPAVMITGVGAVALWDWIATRTNRRIAQLIPALLAPLLMLNGLSTFPETLLTMMKGESKEVIEAFRCNQMRRAAYQGDYKLITVGGKPDELFDVMNDPDELANLIDDRPTLTSELNGLLTDFVLAADMRRPDNIEMARVELDEEIIAERLRGLGYIE